MTQPHDGSSKPSASVAQDYPGQRLGLPADGPRSVASWGRRVVALLVDWLASRLVVGIVAGGAVWSGNGPEQFWVFVVFIGEATLLTSLLGGSFGQLLLRLAVVSVDGRPVHPLKVLLRTVLICLVIPPLVFNRDNRGLHDLAVGTITIRR